MGIANFNLITDAVSKVICPEQEKINRAAIISDKCNTFRAWVRYTP